MPSASICRERRRGGGRLAFVLAYAFAVGTPVLQAQAPAPLPEPLAPARAQGRDVFRSQAELVMLQVTVFDSRGRFVPGLQVEDFGVYEDGRRQTVTFFAAASAPLDLMVLIDTSGSMLGRLALAQDAAIDLIRTLKPGDRGGVVLFSDNVRMAHALSGDQASLEAAVKSARPRGATALYEAVYIAQRELARARQNPAEQRRQAIVVLSDGIDNRSRVEFRDVIDEARRRTTTIFTIVPGPFTDPALQVSLDVKPSMLFEMRELAEETGGRSFTPSASMELAGVYQAIAGELGQQYYLAYTPAPSRVAGFRRIAVRTETQPALRARTRSGYYAAPSHQMGSAGVERVDARR